MNIKIVKNKYLNALFVLMFFSALAHMLILFVLTLKSFNLYVLNYFNILDLDALFPKIIFDSALGNTLSAVFLFGIYFLILLKNKTE